MTVKLLIKYKVDVNVEDNVSISLTQACFYLFRRSSILHIVYGLFTTLKICQEGWTPLHVAIQSRNRDIAKILLVNGADKTRKNKVLMLYIPPQTLQL